MLKLPLTTVLNKSDGDFQQLLCKKQFQRDLHCAKKYFDDISVFLHFPLRDIFLDFCLGFDFGLDSCAS